MIFGDLVITEVSDQYFSVWLVSPLGTGALDCGTQRSELQIARTRLAKLAPRPPWF